MRTLFACFLVCILYLNGGVANAKETVTKQPETSAAVKFSSSNAEVYLSAEKLALENEEHDKAQQMIHFALSDLELNSHERAAFEKLLAYSLIETNLTKEAADILERLAFEGTMASASDFRNVCQLRIKLEEFQAASRICGIWHELEGNLTADQLWQLSIVEHRNRNLEPALSYLKSVMLKDKQNGADRDGSFEFLIYLYGELGYRDESILALRDRWESNRDAKLLDTLLTLYHNHVGGIDSLEWVEIQLADPRNSEEDRIKLSQLLLMQDHYKLTSNYHALLKKLRAEFGADFPAMSPIYGMTPAPKGK